MHCLTWQTEVSWNKKKYYIETLHLIELDMSDFDLLNKKNYYVDQ